MRDSHMIYIVDRGPDHGRSVFLDWHQANERARETGCIPMSWSDRDGVTSCKYQPPGEILCIRVPTVRRGTVVPPEIVRHWGTRIPYAREHVHSTMALFRERWEKEGMRVSLRNLVRAIRAEFDPGWFAAALLGERQGEAWDASQRTRGSELIQKHGYADGSALLLWEAVPA